MLGTYVTHHEGSGRLLKAVFAGVVTCATGKEQGRKAVFFGRVRESGCGQPE